MKMKGCIMLALLLLVHATLADSSERYPETRTRVLQAQDIQGWDDAKLRYAINEMYARHGADFKDKEIKKWFLHFDWYHPKSGTTYEMAEADFSEIEKRNVQMLGDWRKNASDDGSKSSTHDKPRSATIVEKS